MHTEYKPNKSRGRFKSQTKKKKQTNKHLDLTTLKVNNNA